jgi:hypothetical protein
MVWAHFCLRKKIFCPLSHFLAKNGTVDTVGKGKHDNVRQGQNGVKKRAKVFAVFHKKVILDYGKNFCLFLAGLFYIPLPV